MAWAYPAAARCLGSLAAVVVVVVSFLGTYVEGKEFEISVEDLEEEERRWGIVVGTAVGMCDRDLRRDPGGSMIARAIAKVVVGAGDLRTAIASMTVVRDYRCSVFVKDCDWDCDSGSSFDSSFGCGCDGPFGYFAFSSAHRIRATIHSMFLRLEPRPWPHRGLPAGPVRPYLPLRRYLLVPVSPIRKSDPHPS